MSNITVWTKQHENVLKELETAGRYIAKQEYIRMDLKEQAPVVLEAYDWLVKHGPDRANKLADVEYPVWVCDPTLHRADAQVALGHAKSVRLALQVTGQECYGRSGTFFDASKEGGVAESIWTEVLNLSKAPGDFWVLQMAEDGYTVEKFVYREGDYTVWYTLEPKSYTVYYEDYMAGKEE